MYQLSPNIEILFTEAGEHPDRVRAAAAAGFDAVEMWGTSTVDVEQLAAALQETGVSLTSVLAEPRTNFALPWETLDAFFEGLERGIEHAQRLGCPRIVLGSGVGFPGQKRVQNLARLVEVFSEAVQRTEGSGVKLILEPVNTRVDHPGALTDRTVDAVTVARGVGSDSFGILYDMYHSITEGEDPATELANAAGLVDYVQIADVPGRGEPGSGGLDWTAQLGVLRASGYAGPIGLEFFPTISSEESVKHIREVAANA
ncbi:sugar phosphate isomerase/epimerase family protein [Marmoricola sp. URHB0036]|uniref:sugar phosphate isomerase/epimerase family protein n=1 Tax=Marmoricola sp. URHB0036 TaxID=1298863 RepID=UPI0003F544C1|nr:sugar phosphate isomerase/epimerase family protein [Marmoricola sp. URHB0036]